MQYNLIFFVFILENTLLNMSEQKKLLLNRINNNNMLKPPEYKYINIMVIQMNYIKIYMNVLKKIKKLFIGK